MNSVHEGIRTIEELQALVAFHEAQVARQDSLPSRERALSYLNEVRDELRQAITLAEKYQLPGKIKPIVVKSLPRDVTHDWSPRKKCTWKIKRGTRDE